MLWPVCYVMLINRVCMLWFKVSLQSVVPHLGGFCGTFGVFYRKREKQKSPKTAIFAVKRAFLWYGQEDLNL